MALSSAQQAQLKTNIAANAATIPAGQPWTGSFAGQAISGLPNSGDANAAIAGWYNLAAIPTFTLWRKSVPLSEVANKLNGTDLAGLSSLNHTRLQTVVMLSQGGVDASMTDRRQFFDDIFSGAGGTTTRTNLLSLWKRFASNVEKLFAVGTGSDAGPAISAFADGFTVNGVEIQGARDSP